MTEKHCIAKCAGWLLAMLSTCHFGRYAESAALTFYVAPTALGDGSGSSPANAASYKQTSVGIDPLSGLHSAVDSPFWTGVKSSLATNSVTVQMAAGTYPTELVLKDIGNFDNKFTLQGAPGGGTVFNPSASATQNTALYLVAATNTTITNVNFTGPNLIQNAFVISSNSGDQRLDPATKLSQKIVVDGCSFTNLTSVSLGAVEVVFGSKDVSIRNSTFNTVGVDSHAHMIYNSYSVSHISAYNNTFTDIPGDYVRFRDQSDYGTVINNTFSSTKAATAQNFVTMPLFNDVNPSNNPNNLPMELFGTHYTVANNSFHYATSTGTDQRTFMSFTQAGYEPPGTNYLPSAADGAILTNTNSSNTATKKALLKSGMGIDTDEVHFYGNSSTTSANAYRTAEYTASANYGAVSQGWTGAASITATLNTTIPSTTIGSKRVDWKFGAGEGWTNNSTASLQNAGWQFRAGTATSGNGYVDTAKTIGGATGVLYLGDSISASALSADYKFQRLVTGGMSWRMGMGGEGSSFGLSEGRINEGGLSLLSVELLDSHTLRILSNSATTQDLSFAGVDFGLALDWQLNWTSDLDGVNGFATLLFKDQAGLWQSVYANRPYDSNVAPDTVWFDTGTNSVANFIFLDSLAVVVPEPMGLVPACFALGGAALLFRKSRVQRRGSKSPLAA